MPVAGSPDEIAGVLRAFAAQGISHVQLVVDPITLASLDALAPVLEALDR
jgi:alkanesulfonate monooxygenase SsuD/methylene tetrahydromethanopterin reductase-like flavin-dependent oxidoreductase (luciferase family)